MERENLMNWGILWIPKVSALLLEKGGILLPEEEPLLLEREDHLLPVLLCAVLEATFAPIGPIPPSRDA